MTEAHLDAGSKGGAGIVVYVVEDDESVRRAFVRLLRAAGIEPRPYESVQRFLADVSDQPGACILLDMAVSCEASVQLRERALIMPLVAVSVRDHEPVRRKARSLGAKFFLPKPVEGQALVDAIKSVTSAKNDTDSGQKKST
ncbi:MAG TPA: response regulator [Bradyrhizobium sp.]|nr:response regulator [Bradyrhizobium sp.]